MTPFSKRIEAFVEDTRFEKVIVSIILLNAFVLGAETFPELMESHGTLLKKLDQIFLWIFVSELLFKLLVYRFRFFLEPWRIFDLLVVGVALVPATGSLSALRAFRAFRLLRLITVLPQLRQVVTGLLNSIPSLGAVMAIMSVIFYVCSVVATKLFAADFPEWFGTLGKSAFSLFQVMTLESWSMGIARNVMNVFPQSWIFFVLFILTTTFTMLNLFVAVIVNSMQAESEQAAERRSELGHQERLEILATLRRIEERVKQSK